MVVAIGADAQRSWRALRDGDASQVRDLGQCLLQSSGPQQSLPEVVCVAAVEIRFKLS